VPDPSPNPPVLPFHSENRSKPDDCSRTNKTILEIDKTITITREQMIDQFVVVVWRCYQKPRGRMGTTAFHRSGHLLLHHTPFHIRGYPGCRRRNGERTSRTYFDTTSADNYISLVLSGSFSTTGRSIELVFLHPHTQRYIYLRFILTCSYLLF